MRRGNMVPPNSPIIIRPDTSFFLSGKDSTAWENTSEKMLELPKPTNAMAVYRTALLSPTARPNMERAIMTTET